MGVQRLLAGLVLGAVRVGPWMQDTMKLSLNQFRQGVEFQTLITNCPVAARSTVARIISARGHTASGIYVKLIKHKIQYCDHALQLAILALLYLLFFRSAFASLCGDSVVIHADKEIVSNGTFHYQGNVRLTSGMIQIYSSELLVNENSISAMTYQLAQAQFLVSRKDKVVQGRSDMVIFRVHNCILDLVGHSNLADNGTIKEYNNIRYLLDTDEIKPLSVFVDESIPVTP